MKQTDKLMKDLIKVTYEDSKYFIQKISKDVNELVDYFNERAIDEFKCSVDRDVELSEEDETYYLLRHISEEEVGLTQPVLIIYESELFFNYSENYSKKLKKKIKDYFSKE